jgi:hypothetical protein
LCQNGGLSVLSSVKETEKSRVGGGDIHVVFGQKFPGENGSVSCCDTTASSFVAKVRSEVYAHFHSVVIKHQNRM